MTLGCGTKSGVRTMDVLKVTLDITAVEYSDLYWTVFGRDGL